MRGGRGHADARKYARWVNAVAEMLGAGVPVAKAAHLLADQFGCSLQQARRYAERAAQDEPRAVPEEMTVFTVKLPTVQVTRVCEQARESESTISAVVVQTLTEFLVRGRRKRPRR